MLFYLYLYIIYTLFTVHFKYKADLEIHRNLSYLSRFISLLLAALGLCGSVKAFSGCDEQGRLFVAGWGLLILVASLAAEPGP